MCHYKALTPKKEDMIEVSEQELNLDGVNIPVAAGHQRPMWPIIINNNSKYEIVPMQWGIIPYFINTKEELLSNNFKYSFYNSRSDKLLESNIWKNPARERRCLIPVTSFFEFHHKSKTGKKGQTLKATDKFPFCIHRSDNRLMLMAGIYQPWTDQSTGESTKTYSVVTTTGNNTLAKIHNADPEDPRMPVILTKELAEKWLQPNLTDNEILSIANYQWPGEQLSFYTVAKTFRESAYPTEVCHYVELENLFS
jgi:putative SOS response-associated peptidase YedK